MDGRELRRLLRQQYEAAISRMGDELTIGEQAAKEKLRHEARDEAMDQYALAVEELQEWGKLCKDVEVKWPKAGA